MAYLLGFNNNIRCIEIVEICYSKSGGDRFNNNIRCIEIKNKITDTEAEACLITT